jgi:hypothetical protein
VERVASRLEEVVTGAEPAAQDLLPDSRDELLQLVAGHPSLEPFLFTESTNHPSNPFDEPVRDQE